MQFRRHGTGLALLVLLQLCGSQNALSEGKSLPKVEIAKRGKAATGFLLSGRSSGTAFCVNPSGLFLTNSGVVQSAGGQPLRLILNPGLKNQQLLSAKVIRTDHSLGLALLKVESREKLPALPLGSAKGLTELAEVVALGFSIDARPVPVNEEYPSVSVRAGSISSLQRAKGELSHVQIDVNPGFPGGPVLDRQGRVVALVTGSSGARSSSAVPVNRLKEFASEPLVQFDPPTITPLNRHRPVTFKVQAGRVLPSAKPIRVDLKLTVEGNPRTLRMKSDGGVYHATVVPIPETAPRERIRAIVEFDHGIVSGHVQNQSIRVGDHKLKLSEIRSLRLRKAPAALLLNWKLVTGPLADLKEILVEAGGQKWQLSLKKASTITIDSHQTVLPVSYEILIQSGENPLARLKGEIDTSSSSLVQRERELDSHLRFAPMDNVVRLNLGTIQFIRAIERLGQSWYRHGIKPASTSAPFLRIPVPVNPAPAVVDYSTFRQILDRFHRDLGDAEKTLSAITQDNVKLSLRLARIRLDLDGDGQATDQFSDVLKQVMGRQLTLLRDNPDFLVRLDRGDVAWLRAYCHLLMGMLDAYLAVDTEVFFNEFADDVFLKAKKRDLPKELRNHPGLVIAEPKRLGSFRIHLIRVAELNRETWKHVRAESDNDFEWLPSPKQQGVLGLPVRDEMIDAWLDVVAETEALLKGNKVLPALFGVEKNETGLNVKTFLDDPPKEISDLNLPDKYWSKLPVVDIDKLFRFFAIFEGPSAVAYAAWFN